MTFSINRVALELGRIANDLSRVSDINALEAAPELLRRIVKTTQSIPWGSPSLNRQTLAAGYFDPCEEILVELQRKLLPVFSAGDTDMGRVSIKDMRMSLSRYLSEEKRATFKPTMFVERAIQFASAFEGEIENFLF